MAAVAVFGAPKCPQCAPPGSVRAFQAQRCQRATSARPAAGRAVTCVDEPLLTRAHLSKQTDPIRSVRTTLTDYSVGFPERTAHLNIADSVERPARPPSPDGHDEQPASERRRGERDECPRWRRAKRETLPRTPVPGKGAQRVLCGQPAEQEEERRGHDHEDDRGLHARFDGLERVGGQAGDHGDKRDAADGRRRFRLSEGVAGTRRFGVGRRPGTHAAEDRACESRGQGREGARGRKAPCREGSRKCAVVTLVTPAQATASSTSPRKEATVGLFPMVFRSRVGLRCCTSRCSQRRHVTR